VGHPIVEAVAALDAVLKDVADTNPSFMTTTDKATALTDLVAVESRVAELRMRILACAGDVAESTGARDAGVWLAHAARLRPKDVRAESRLAGALDRERPRLATALRDGDVNVAQAHVIHRALTRLPADTPAETVTEAEEALVGYAATFGPVELTRLGRRILHTIAPDIAEELEARSLADLEARAADKTRLTIRRLGDGTTRLSARLPDHIGVRLATYLHSYTSPRHQHRVSTPLDQREEGVSTSLDQQPYPRRLGQAFCSLLEHLDPQRLPLHGGDATTLMVTIGFDSLKDDLATAELLDEVTGEDQITAAQARRLACTAKILPVVLDEKSHPLDLGRSKRLFTPAQRKALLLRDRTCRAEGCDVPGTWAEAHHLTGWAHGGCTDLEESVLFCPHDHHKAHDPRYRLERLPNGDIRFHRRR